MGGRNQKEWAVYKGDKFIFMGTTKECAAFLNVSPESVRHYSTPTYLRRVERRKTFDRSTITVEVSD